MKISRLRTLLIGFAHVAALTVLPTMTYGAVIPGGLDPSADVLFNFDLTGDSTAFDSVTLSYFLSSPDAGGGNQGGGGGSTVSVTVDIFGGLNGTDLLLTTGVVILETGTSPEQSELGLLGVLDGLFSVGLRVAPGVNASGLLSAFGEFTIDGGGGNQQGPITVTTNPVAGVLVSNDPAPVPEPGMLALLGLSGAGVAFAWRRTR